MRPDIIVVGAFKAGTTSLHHYLGQHPQIFMTRVKEPNYFAYEGGLTSPSSDFPVITLEDYEALFAEAEPGQLLGEASPGYLHSAIAPERIHQLAPNAKLIVSLRNPVERAYSHYLMNYRTGRTRLSPAMAFDASEFWVSASFYAEALNMFKQLFGEQLKVILFEQLSNDGDLVVNQLFEWIGLPQIDHIDSAQRHNPGGIPKNRFVQSSLEFLRNRSVVKKMVPPKIRTRLAKVRNANLKPAPALPELERARWQAHFSEDIRRTQDIVGMDLSSWLK